MALQPPPVQDQNMQSVVWKDWLYKLQRELTQISHATLAGLQGGAVGEYYHLTDAQHEQASVLRNNTSSTAPVTWNPDDTALGLVLSNNNLTVDLESAPNKGISRATVGVSSGKYYWEVNIGTAAFSTKLDRVGFADGTHDLDINLGDTGAGGQGVGVAGDSSSNFVWHDGTNIGTLTTSWTRNKTVMWALDLDNNQCWFGVDGTWYSLSGSPNPSTLTDPLINSLAADTYYPAAGLQSGGTEFTAPQTAVFAAGNLTYTIPTGFTTIPVAIEITTNSFVLPVSAGQSVGLPSGSSWDGRILIVKKTDAGSTATVTAAGGTTIDGASSLSLTGQYDFLVMQLDGSTWWIIGRYESGEFTDATADAVSFNRRYTLLLT